jgi:protein-disulfide isomerase
MVVEFSDLECPFCRKFHSTLREARQTWGDSVAYTFIHYPLDFHKNAYAAARAAECAHSQGRFEQFLDIVFAKQDSMGRIPWSSLAREAAVPDPEGFAVCIADSASVDRVERGRAVGSLLRIRGTPTVIVNGWRFASTPPDSPFRRVVADLLGGREPFR